MKLNDWRVSVLLYIIFSPSFQRGLSEMTTWITHHAGLKPRVIEIPVREAKVPLSLSFARRLLTYLLL